MYSFCATVYIIAFYFRHADKIPIKLPLTGLTSVQAVVVDCRIIRAAIFDSQGEGVLPGTVYEMGQEAQEAGQTHQKCPGCDPSRLVTSTSQIGECEAQKKA